MSAFVVDASTLNRAVSAMNYAQQRSMACEDCDQLGRNLLRLNHQAVSICYPDKSRQSYHGPLTEEDEYDINQWRWRPSTIHTHRDKVQGLKSLQCLMYQCSEGDIRETSDLFKQMELVEHGLLAEIVTCLPEYNAAKWG